MLSLQGNFAHVRDTVFIAALCINDAVQNTHQCQPNVINSFGITVGVGLYDVVDEFRDTICSFFP